MITQKKIMLCPNIIRSFPVEWREFCKCVSTQIFTEKYTSLTLAVGYKLPGSDGLCLIWCFRKWYNCWCAAGCCWIVLLWACCSIFLFRMAKNPNFQEVSHLPSGYIHCQSSDSFAGEWTSVFSWDFNLMVYLCTRLYWIN